MWWGINEIRKFKLTEIRTKLTLNYTLRLYFKGWTQFEIEINVQAALHFLKIYWVCCSNANNEISKFTRKLEYLRIHAVSKRCFQCKRKRETDRAKRSCISLEIYNYALSFWARATRSSRNYHHGYIHIARKESAADRASEFCEMYAFLKLNVHTHCVYSNLRLSCQASVKEERERANDRVAIPIALGLYKSRRGSLTNLPLLHLRYICVRSLFYFFFSLFVLIEAVKYASSHFNCDVLNTRQA